MLVDVEVEVEVEAEVEVEVEDDVVGAEVVVVRAVVVVGGTKIVVGLVGIQPMLKSIQSIRQRITASILPSSQGEPFLRLFGSIRSGFQKDDREQGAVRD